MPRLNLSARFWGRPVKPVSLGLAIVFFANAAAHLTGNGAYPPNLLGWGAFVIDAVVFTFLMLGWWARSQRFAEWGLLGAFGAFVVNVVFVLLTLGPWSPMVGTTVGAAIVAGGSYLLERLDDREVR